MAAEKSGEGKSLPVDRPPLPEFRKFGVTPEIQQIIIESGMYIDSEPGTKGERTGRAGEIVVYLATLTDKEKTSRWVIQLRALPTAAEAQAKLSPTVKYSSSGNQWTLSHRQSTIEVTVLRPLARRKTEPQLLLANDDALNAGLWGIVSTTLKVKDASLPRVAYAPEFRDAPFPDEGVQAGRALAATLGITPPEELSHGMVYPALMEFLSLITSVPELLTMMSRVADVSSVSLLAAMKGEAVISITDQMSTIPAERVGLEGSDTAYVLPLTVSVGKKPIMLCQLALVRPRLPLQLGAGLVGLAAGHPDGKGPVLTLELVGRSFAK